MKISVQELLIVLAIVVIIFGPTQIPKLIRMIKKGAKSVQEGMAEAEETEEEVPAAKKAAKKKTVKKEAEVEETDAEDEE